MLEQENVASQPEAEQKPEQAQGESLKLTPEDLEKEAEYTTNGKTVKRKVRDILSTVAPAGEKVTQKFQAFSSIAKKLNIAITPDTRPEEVESAMWQRLETTLKNTPDGKEWLKKAYADAFGEQPSGTAKEQIAQTQIPEELKDTLGEGGVQKLLELIPKDTISKQDLEKFKVDLVKTVKEEMEVRELQQEAEGQVADLEKELDVKLPKSLHDSLIQAWADADEDTVTIKRIWDEEFTPILQKIASGKKLSAEEQAKIVGEGIKGISEKPTPPKAEGGGISPAKTEAKTYDEAKKGLDDILDKLGIPRLG